MNRLLKNIAKKLLRILPIPQPDWMVERILKFYDIIQVEKELNILNRKQRAGMMNFRHYLPDTEERIERLRRVIDKRPVAIILHGSSATELEERITELENCDICYFSLSAFRVIEKNILQKIGRNLSLAMDSAAPAEQLNDIIDFLERQEDNIFISAKESFRPQKMPPGFHLDKFIKKYDKKLLFFTSTFTVMTVGGGLRPQVPSRVYPLHFPRQNSFTILLSLAAIGGASKVVVFGGDGGRIGTRELYYRKSGDWSSPEPVLEKSIMVDARVFNATMPLILERIYEIYNLKPIDIINCSEQSHYTPFRKLSYDETFALLKSFRKDTD